MIEKEIHLHDYVQIILRRRWIILSFFITLVVTVFIGSLKQKPIYQATVTLLIQKESPRVVSFEEVTPLGTTDYQTYREYYETQYKLIKSRSVLSRVLDSLNLKDNFAQKKNDPVDRFSRIISVMPVKNSQLVEIAVEYYQPQMAAKISNAIADEYMRQNLERSVGAASDAMEWLSKKIAEQRQKVMESESVLQAYRERHSINILPQVTSEQAVEDVKAEYAKLQAMLDNYSQRYTDEHPRMVELKAQINSLKNKIQGLEDVGMGNKTMEYMVLEREVQTNKQMYEILLARFKEVKLSSTLVSNNINVVDWAQVPQRPIKPNLKLNMMLAVMTGLIMGTGLGFFVDYLDTTIKSPEDIKEILKAHFLGAVPEIKEYEEKEKDKIAFLEPKSPISESYRAIRTEICHLMPQGDNLKTIVITSAEPQAGKTVTAVNLGISLAQKGCKVLLVDSDLRKPQLHRIFNVAKIGLSEFLRGEVNLDSVIKDTEIENLKVITCGQTPQNPAEILSCAKMKEFISEAKNKFDLIIFDSPPVISVTDAIILADMADFSIQVVRSGNIPVPVTLRAKERLSQTKAKDLGVILNDVKPYAGHYYYDYYKYYHYYGEDSKRADSLNKSCYKPKEKATAAFDKTWDALKSDSRKIMLLIKDRISTYKNNKFEKKNT